MVSVYFSIWKENVLSLIYVVFELEEVVIYRVSSI